MEGLNFGKLLLIKQIVNSEEYFDESDDCSTDPVPY